MKIPPLLPDFPGLAYMVAKDEGEAALAIERYTELHGFVREDGGRERVPMRSQILRAELALLLDRVARARVRR